MLPLVLTLSVWATSAQGSVADLCRYPFKRLSVVWRSDVASYSIDGNGPLYFPAPASKDVPVWVTDIERHLKPFDTGPYVFLPEIRTPQPTSRSEVVRCQRLTCSKLPLWLYRLRTLDGGDLNDPTLDEANTQEFRLFLVELERLRRSYGQPHARAMSWAAELVQSIVSESRELKAALDDFLRSGGALEVGLDFRFGGVGQPFFGNTEEVENTLGPLVATNWVDSGQTMVASLLGVFALSKELFADVTTTHRSTAVKQAVQAVVASGLLRHALDLSLVDFTSFQAARNHYVHKGNVDKEEFFAVMATLLTAPGLFNLRQKSRVDVLVFWRSILEQMGLPEHAIAAFVQVLSQNRGYWKRSFIEIQLRARFQATVQIWSSEELGARYAMARALWLEYLQWREAAISPFEPAPAAVEKTAQHLLRGPIYIETATALEHLLHLNRKEPVR